MPASASVRAAFVVAALVAALAAAHLPPPALVEAAGRCPIAVARVPSGQDAAS